MNNYMDNDTFDFGKEEIKDDVNFNYDSISGLGESNYENEDLFDTEVENNDEVDAFQIFKPQSFEEQPIEEEKDEFVPNFGEYENEELQNISDNTTVEEDVQNQPTLEEEFVPSFGEYNNEESQNIESDLEENTFEDFPVSEVVENNVQEENFNIQKNIDEEFLDSSDTFKSNAINDEYIIPVVEPTVEPSENMFSETPIEQLNELTEYKEEKVDSMDIKALFDKVGVNVKEASDIFKKNTEMKEKIDSRFEELKKLQSEVESAKKAQYDEINAYKTEVLDKLTEKKEEIEKRLNKLKEFQASLEKEKEEFEEYRRSEKEEIERVQKEIQEAYDGRREELNHIEDVLRKQKDALDEERSQLVLDRIQYESDKNDLANNLLKFNEIVGSFTNGMDKISE